MIPSSSMRTAVHAGVAARAAAQPTLPEHAHNPVVALTHAHTNMYTRPPIHSQTERGSE